MNKPEKLILDYSKWRCGGYGDNRLGKGGVQLLNKDGYSCTIGIFARYLGATIEQLQNKVTASGCEFQIPLSFSLIDECIGINDDWDTTPEQKLIKLESRLQQEGIQLEVINKP